jgi:hypothetical protein
MKDENETHGSTSRGRPWIKAGSLSEKIKSSSEKMQIGYFLTYSSRSWIQLSAEVKRNVVITLTATWRTWRTTESRRTATGATTLSLFYFKKSDSR